MIYRLVFENLKHRPVRTALSALAIGVQVTMILVLVGVSRGMLADLANRSRGTNADIFVRPPNSSVVGFNSDTMREGILRILRQQPHVVLATGTLIESLGGLNTVTGIDFDTFNQMSGGLVFVKGEKFQAPNDVIIDEIFAREKHLKVGDNFKVGREWHVSGVVVPGKLSRMFADLKSLQDMYSLNDKLSAIYLKLDNPANTNEVIAELKQIPNFGDYNIISAEDFLSQFSVNNIPLIKPFTAVVIGIAVIVGFLVVFLSMYTAVLERTREIGILKALGASPGYILGILMRETTLLAIVGTIAGIAMSYGTRDLLAALAPSFPQTIVYDWWPIALGIALVGSLIGAAYPGLKAARQDPIEALAYD